MSRVIDYLRRFNRKERFILLNHVLGQRGEDAFRLNRHFAGKLANTLGLEIPADAFVAMDYHLDWIQMAIYLADNDHRNDIDNPQIDPKGNVRKLFQANQEDIDLLVAFEEKSNDERSHIVLIEAKGDTKWDSKQLKSKAARLKLIFKQNSCVNVEPHFILMSPDEPRTGTATEWLWIDDGGVSPAKWLELPLLPSASTWRCASPPPRMVRTCPMYSSRSREERKDSERLYVETYKRGSGWRKGLHVP